MMDGLICKGVLVVVLALIVWIGYSCLVMGARQDEIRKRDWEEFCGEENEEEIEKSEK